MDVGGRIGRKYRRFELENDFGGLWWTGYRRHGIQKVRGSNPLGSTKIFELEIASRSLGVKRADRGLQPILQPICSLLVITKCEHS